MTDFTTDTLPTAAAKFRLVRLEVSKARSDASSLADAAERELAQRVRDRPMRTVLIALVTGLLLGRAL